MSFHNQKILPAIRSMKEFEKMLDSPYQYGVFLDMQIGHLRSAYRLAKEHHRHMFLHFDLIQGLSRDEFATDFVCQEFKPFGIISTKSNVIRRAKQKGVLATQRTFIIDSSALNRSVELVNQNNPDFIEVLPGVVPKIITQMHKRTGKRIFAGGLIETRKEVEEALLAGAVAITTSNQALWKVYENK
ncbi:glycerol-3-phosphate responsive antiterminator [Bacillus spongiae]|uniref:Glycerol uptake operon antiterminator regulatory protein n=1 Tax=Bacillus spongiae TaxID=2683610 RepID=A0ABU8HCB5_9BACI